MSNWTTGKELVNYWDIEAFELFGCLKKGLQPYDEMGRKVVDSDLLKRGKQKSLEEILLEEIIKDLGTTRKTPGPTDSSRLSGSERERRARMLYESQKLVILDLPKDHPHVSFTLPQNNKKAIEAIETAMRFRFNKKEISEFAGKHEYRIFNERGDGNSHEQTQIDLNSSGGKYEPWISGKKVKGMLNTDDAGLMHLIKEGHLVPYTKSLNPLTVEDINYRMNDLRGSLLPDWWLSEFDGLRFERGEFVKIAESRGFVDVGIEENTQISQQDLVTSDAKEKQTIQNKQFQNIVAVINTEQKVRWGDIKITFLSDEEILVQYGEEHTQRRFNRAGFEDRRNGRPVGSWTALCKAASRSGEIHIARENRVEIEKIAQDLNKKLKTLFPDISKKPIKLFKRDNLYKPVFEAHSNL